MCMSVTRKPRSRLLDNRMSVRHNRRGVLMVCLGNICRSPTAEAVFLREIEDQSLRDHWFVDSAGTSDWFVGDSPEQRARSVLQSNGLNSSHRARQITDRDFDLFDFILGMDEQNVRDIQRMKPEASEAVIGMLGRYDPDDDSDIVDPYFRQDDRLYHVCYDRCVRAVRGFLQQHKYI